jgi:3-methyladenine DNA glycosylase AlkD
MDVEELIEATQRELRGVADPARAAPMAAYMKTDMPFYGVQKAGRSSVLRTLKRDHPPDDVTEYREAVLGLWQLPHREEKYLAISYARAFNEYITTDAMELYERLLVDGAWWDFVDEIASHLVGRVLLRERSDLAPTMRSWISADNIWLRRTSIICQLRHKAETDTAMLDDACTSNLPDTEFFIRKAVGWALREYAKTDPDWVRSYVETHQGELSGLSYREATKHL